MLLCRGYWFPLPVLAVFLCPMNNVQAATLPDVPSTVSLAGAAPYLSSSQMVAQPLKPPELPPISTTEPPSLSHISVYIAKNETQVQQQLLAFMEMYVEAVDTATNELQSYNSKKGYAQESFECLELFKTMAIIGRNALYGALTKNAELLGQIDKKLFEIEYEPKWKRWNLTRKLYESCDNVVKVIDIKAKEILLSSVSGITKRKQKAQICIDKAFSEDRAKYRGNMEGND